MPALFSFITAWRPLMRSFVRQEQRMNKFCLTKIRFQLSAFILIIFFMSLPSSSSLILVMNLNVSIAILRVSESLALTHVRNAYWIKSPSLFFSSCPYCVKEQGRVAEFWLQLSLQFLHSLFLHIKLSMNFDLAFFERSTSDFNSSGLILCCSLSIWLAERKRNFNH